MLRSHPMLGFRTLSRAKALLASAFALLMVGLFAPALAAAWTTPVDLSRDGQDAFQPRVAVDAGGDAVFGWRRSDGTNQRIQTATRTVDGNLSAVQEVSKGGQDAVDPDVAVDPGGNAVFTWTRFTGTINRVQARTLSTDGTLGSIQGLSADGQNAADPHVAVDAGGDAVLVWRRFDGANQRIETRTRFANGTLSPVQTLSDAGQDAVEPRVAVDADGNAVFTWTRFDGSTNRVQARALSA